MIVTTVLSLWTKDSRPEKFDFASFMFITVGMVILSFSREEEDAGIIYHILANKDRMSTFISKDAKADFSCD